MELIVKWNRTGGETVRAVTGAVPWCEGVDGGEVGHVVPSYQWLNQAFSSFRLTKRWRLLDRTRTNIEDKSSFSAARIADLKS